MQDFNFHRPATVADAVKALAGAADGRALAGGQSLLGSMKLGLLAPSDLVDLSRIAELRGIRVEGGAVHVGAATPHAVVAASAEVRKAIPALAALAGGIGDRAVRTMGTIGGSLANSDPAACYHAAVLGLGATVRTDRRTIAADDFFKGLYETALAPGELITGVSFPVPEKAAYVKFRQPASRFSIVGVFVSRSAAGVRVAVTGAGPCVFRAKALEAALAANWSQGACASVAVPSAGLNNDLHGSAEYRAHLIPVLAGRAVAQAG
jgi:carbon-monoxide dehydrogenase medium subunit